MLPLSASVANGDYFLLSFFWLVATSCLRTWLVSSVVSQLVQVQISNMDMGNKSELAIKTCSVDAAKEEKPGI